MNKKGKKGGIYNIRYMLMQKIITQRPYIRNITTLKCLLYLLCYILI